MIPLHKRPSTCKWRRRELTALPKWRNHFFSSRHLLVFFFRRVEEFVLKGSKVFLFKNHCFLCDAFVMCWRLSRNHKTTKEQRTIVRMRATEEKIKFKLCQGRFGVGVNANYNRLMRDIVFSTSSLWLSVYVVVSIHDRPSRTAEKKGTNVFWDCYEIILSCKWKERGKWSCNKIPWINLWITWRNLFSCSEWTQSEWSRRKLPMNWLNNITGLYVRLSENWILAYTFKFSAPLFKALNLDQIFHAYSMHFASS